MVRMAVSDISEHMSAENDLRISAIAFEAREGIVITDSAGRILKANRTLVDLMGYPAEELAGQRFPLIAAGPSDDPLLMCMWAILQQDRYWQGEVSLKRRIGGTLSVWLTVSVVTTPEGRVSHYVGTLADITPHLEAEARIHRLAFYDSLTLLPNRRLLLERLGQALATSVRSGRHGAVLYIDLDDFKSINDTQGHDAGDKVLIEVGRRLASSVRDCDTVSRMGGDEFVVMLEDLSGEGSVAATQAELVAEKIRAHLVLPVRVGGQKYACTPSIGVCIFHGPADTVEEVLKHADVAMYRAKASGRSGIRFFDPAMQVAVESRAELESDLRDALEKGQLETFFQMQVDDDRRITGAEALLRWKHSSGRLILPGEFLEVAEESGLIVPIGRWVLEAACEQLSAWARLEYGKHLQLSVNVSARQFRQIDFVQTVSDALSRTGANPARLILEFTESLLVDNMADAIRKMRTLRSLGIGLSMDDFGTGYSSLYYLNRLLLGQLKIDQSFVHELGSDSGATAIVETIIGMARTLGLGVIAEGVETSDQLDLLTLRGCTAFQGYLFGPPVGIAEFDMLARSSRRAVPSPD
jgi:diguanylate cyclase (GGDEF)-like protein/PAS domain S-box-containing protein